MNKKLRYSLLTLLLAVFTGAWADTFTKVSSANQIVAGKKYVLVCETQSVAMKVYSSGTKCDAVDVTISNNSVESVTDINVLTLEAGEDGWYFKQEDGKYLYSTAAKNLKADADNKTLCTITDDFQITMGSSGILQYNASSPRFCPYTSTQKSAYLYVLEENALPPIATIGTLSPTEVTVGDLDEFDLDITPTVNTLVEGTDYIVEWETSDDTVLDLDDNTYEALATGTVTVTVTVTPDDDTTYKEVSKTFTVTVMPAPFANIAALAAATTATETQFNVVFENAVVTYVNGSNVYIQDESGAILYYKKGHGLTAGQILNGTATVTSALRNNNPQITALSGVTSTEGSAPLPTEVAAEDWDTPINTVLSQYFKVTGATITKENNKYYVQLDDEKVQLYGQGEAFGFSLDDLETTYTIVGFPTMYNTTPELVIYEVPENENALEDPQLSYAEQSVTVIFGKEYELPELNNPNSLEVEFQSSKEEVATVDEEGNVTLTGNEGSTTIKAIFSGNEVFESGEASYTLIVKLPAPVRAFQKVTATEDITDGNYLIVYQGPKSGTDETEVSVAFNGGLEALDAPNNTIDVDVAGDLIVTDQDAYFTINTTDGTLMSASGKYIGRNNNSNGLDSSETTQYTNTFAIDEDGNAVITASGNCTMRYNYAVDQQRFRYYKSGQKAIYLYKEIPTPETVEVTIKEGFEGTTIASAYPLDLTQAEGLTAYIATGKVGTSKVYITTEAVNAVAPAQTGLLIKGAAGTYQIPVAKPADADETAFAANLLVGAVEGYTPTDTDVAAKTIYRYGKNASGCGFLLVSNTTQTVGAGKAYLRLTEEMAAAAAAYGIAFDGVEVTAIEGVAADSQNVNAPMYNLAGQRVNKSYKGVVIQNGKKMVK